MFLFTPWWQYRDEQIEERNEQMDKFEKVICECIEKFPDKFHIHQGCLSIPYVERADIGRYLGISRQDVDVLVRSFNQSRNRRKKLVSHLLLVEKEQKKELAQIEIMNMDRVERQVIKFAEFIKKEERMGKKKKEEEQEQD